MAAALAVFSGIGWLAFDARLYWLMAVAAAFLALALAFPWVLMPINRLWSTLGHGLGWVNNHLLLGLFYFLFMVPLGLFMRLFGRDPMHRRLEPGTESYFTPISPRTDAETLRDMF